MYQNYQLNRGKHNSNNNNINNDDKNIPPPLPSFPPPSLLRFEKTLFLDLFERMITTEIEPAHKIEQQEKTD